MNKFTHRKTIISGLVICVCAIYTLQLFNLQVIDESYKLSAINNSQRIETQYPARGLIYDRNQKLLVYNQAAYDLMITPRQVKVFDTTELISVLGISKEMLEKNIEKCKRYSPYKASILISQITDTKYALLQEKLYRYTGFFIQTRTLRKYNVAHSADVFGYIGEVSPGQIERDSSYASGDYIGINGLEKSYEKLLSGTKGEKILLVDNYNRIKGSYRNGEYDKPAIVGGNITTTLDIDLQEYAYQLMRNKRGAIVAIEPATGEILLKVSSPGYDPQLLVGLERTENFRKLQRDSTIPLFDRTIMAAYPPGSTFKTVQAMIGLQEKVITTETCFECHSGYSFNGQHMGCHHHASPLDLRGSIQNSCNPYYVNVWRRILEDNKYRNVRESYANWRKYAIAFGFGQKICPDFRNELSGSIPTQAYFDRIHKTQNWHWQYILSLSIGQGELLITPLQIANLAASIANRGYYMTPHIVRPVKKEESKVEKHTIPIDRGNFEVIVEAMEKAASAGTARGAAIDSILVCGKTGTAQNPHGKDHSIFMAFAPMDHPKIAIAVYIENGGFGATYAVPIAGLLMEKYLTGKISERRKPVEERMLEANLNVLQPIVAKTKKGQSVKTREVPID